MEEGRGVVDVTAPLPPQPDDAGERTAVISDDGLYRYRLGRRWGPGEIMVWAMLNPSTADANVDDPTIRRCMGFARREGYDGIEVINLYALRATKPTHLLDHPDPEGPKNKHHWTEVLTDHKVGMVMAGWGAHAGMGHLPASRAADFWRSAGCWRCVGWTKDGYPRHPLYVKGDAEIERFVGATGDR